MRPMKAKTLLAIVVALVACLNKGYAQDQPKTEDKLSVMKEIEGIQELEPSLWERVSHVEAHSVCFGYASYGLPWSLPAMRGGTLGFSYHHLMLGFDFGFGSLIDEAAYDNTDAYNYLKMNSTQGFGFLSVHYYMMKYLSFGIGLGFHSELQKVESIQTENHGNYSIENDKVSFENKGFFGLRLGAKAYIPISERLSLYLSGDYDIMPSDTRKSRLDLGLGLKVAID